MWRSVCVKIYSGFSTSSGLHSPRSSNEQRLSVRHQILAALQLRDGSRRQNQLLLSEQASSFEDTFNVLLGLQLSHKIGLKRSSGLQKYYHGMENIYTMSDTKGKCGWSASWSFRAKDRLLSLCKNSSQWPTTTKQNVILAKASISATTEAKSENT